ncbi:competence protein ComFB [Oleiphilus sp. HI0072]|nr:competence protein ComFB [Oleiphilus sp. HI0072]
MQNYYESLVIETLAKEVEGQDFDEDVLTDVLCIALNHLPPRYIRHEVDMFFYTSPTESHEVEDKARKAVIDALEYVKKSDRYEK